MIRACDKGHTSLDAGNWLCPWCEIERLRAERDALQADAERYRWLRDVHAHHFTVTRYVGGATIPRLHGAELDAAIDAAKEAK